MNTFLANYIKDNEEDNNEAYQVRIQSELQPDLPSIMIDQNQMQRVLNNIVQNSIKYRNKEIINILIQTGFHQGKR